MALAKYHLTKRGNEWRLEKAGSNQALVKSKTKADALRKMSRYMKNRKGSVRIHKVNGRIQDERTYPRKSDPRKTRG